MNAHDLERQMDHDIDRVLRGLSSPPPAHMEQRVLARLEQRPQSASAARPSRLRASVLNLRPRWAFVAAALTLGLLTMALVAHSHQPPQNIATITPAESHAPVTADNPATSVQPLAIASSATHAIQHHASPKTAPTPATDASMPLDPAICHCDPVAIAEASAPSHPAPPVPLTREERHMLMLVGSGEPQQLAVLDPNLRDLEFQRARADFNRFFETPQTKPTSPTNSNMPGNDQP